MTADGGHTLSETLGTAFLAAQNAGKMSLFSKSAVDGLFGHIQAITDPMKNENSRFSHHDMLFSDFDESSDIYRILVETWGSARSSGGFTK